MPAGRAGPKLSSEGPAEGKSAAGSAKAGSGAGSVTVELPVLAGDVGATMEAAAGADAELYELAALIARPGAAPQPLHADTLWTEGGCLYTAFVEEGHCENSDSTSCVWLGLTNSVDVC